MMQLSKKADNYRLITAVSSGLKTMIDNPPKLSMREMVKTISLSALVLVTMGIGVSPVEIKSQSGVYEYPMVQTPEMTVHDYATDKRTLALQKFLEDKGSPVADKAAVYVYAADYYDLKPWPILAAISGKESSFCKRIPHESYNCYGWGITDGRVRRFESYEEGIMTVAEGLRRKYYDKGLDTIPKIESRYTPISATTHHGWQKGVTQFVGQIEDEYHELIQLADASAGW